MSPPLSQPSVAWPAGRPHGTDRAYFGIITNVRVPQGSGLTLPPNQIRYDAVAIQTEDNIVLTNALPVGRPTRDGESIPAGNGSLCLILIKNFGPNGGSASLYILSEYISGDPCPGAAPQAEGSGELFVQLAGGDA